MIHRFRVRNFQSIRDEVELDLRIPSTTPNQPRFRESRARPEVRLPSVVVLIGPNGAGKTALLRAMTATIDFVVHSIGLDSFEPVPYFVPFLSPRARAGPTRIEVDFDTGWFSSGPDDSDLPCRYTLEFRRGASDLHPVGVSYEALHTFPRNRPRRILERRERGPVYVARELKIRPSDSRLVSVPANASVISTFAKFDVEPFPLIAADFMAVQRNIAGPEALQPSTDLVTRFYRDNPELVTRLSDRLQRSDLGIERMRVEPLPDGRWILVFDHQGSRYAGHSVERIYGYPSSRARLSAARHGSPDRPHRDHGCPGFRASHGAGRRSSEVVPTSGNQSEWSAVDLLASQHVRAGRPRQGRGLHRREELRRCHQRARRTAGSGPPPHRESPEGLSKRRPWRASHARLTNGAAPDDTTAAPHLCWNRGRERAVLCGLVATSLRRQWAVPNTPRRIPRQRRRRRPSRRGRGSPLSGTFQPARTVLGRVGSSGRRPPGRGSTAWPRPGDRLARYESASHPARAEN